MSTPHLTPYTTNQLSLAMKRTYSTALNLVFRLLANNGLKKIRWVWREGSECSQRVTGCEIVKGSRKSLKICKMLQRNMNVRKCKEEGALLPIRGCSLSLRRALLLLPLTYTYSPPPSPTYLHLPSSSFLLTYTYPPPPSPPYHSVLWANIYWN